MNIQGVERRTQKLEAKAHKPVVIVNPFDDCSEDEAECRKAVAFTLEQMAMGNCVVPRHALGF